MTKTIHYSGGCAWSGGNYHFDTRQTKDWNNVTCKHCLKRKPTRTTPYDMGEVNGVRLTYVSGNVFATPAGRILGSKVVTH
jgi:hypothetical protein